MISYIRKNIKIVYNYLLNKYILKNMLKIKMVKKIK